MIFKPHDFLECLISGLKYLPNTLLMTFIPVITGLIIGTFVAILQLYRVTFISQLLSIIITIYNGIPFVLTLMLLNTFYTLNFNKIAKILHINADITTVNKIWIGIIVLSLMDIALMSEALRGAFESINKFQYEAGYAIGLTTFQTLRRIIIPQVIPLAVPILINNITLVLKTSAIAFSLGIFEVYNGSILPCNITYSFLEGYVAAGIIFWLLSIIIESIGRIIEQNSSKFNKNIVKGGV